MSTFTNERPNKKPIRSTKPIEAFNMFGASATGQLVFARQFPLRNLDDYNNESTYPRILVGFDGEMGVDLAEVLKKLADYEQRDRLREYEQHQDILKRVYKLESKRWYDFLKFWKWPIFTKRFMWY